ncbi:MAG TPA: PilW family protein [Noviherbaspirillum sp.]
MKPISSLPLKVRQSGFSLVELMVAITIGLLLLAGLAGVFTTTSASRNEVDRTNRRIENGRYAVQLLMEDLRLAGYLGELDPSSLATPASKPDPCATATADLKAAMPLHIQGYDDGASAPACLQDLKAGTDIVVVRRSSTCVAGVGDCEAVTAGAPYFQASLCYPTSGATELASGNINQYFALDANTAALTMHKKDCTTLASLRRYRTHIYFIANNNEGSDGIPTLKRAELGGTGGNTAFTIVPLVEGIENLQLEYGIDTDAKGSANAGSPNAYTTDPDTYDTCVGQACLEHWRNVVAVKLHLLARNTDRSVGYTDTKTYTLGLDADNAAKTVGPFNDGYKRHVYQSSIRLSNPAGRKEP